MVESDVKIYISSLSGNKEVKKRQQRVTMILDSKHIAYTVIDITEPTMEKEKDFMQANSTELGITVSDTNPRHPLPPQIFNGQSYCGDYNSFELSNENDELEAFLKLEPAKTNGVSAPAPVVSEKIEEVAVNGKDETLAAENNEQEAASAAATDVVAAVVDEPKNGETTEETKATTETTTETNEAAPDDEKVEEKTADDE